MANAWLGALAIVAACSSGTPPPSSPGTGAVTIETEHDANANTGKRVGVAGRAGNAKLGAVVTTEAGLVVYCGGVDQWPSELADRPVTAYGTLVRDDSHAATLGPGGDVSQGPRGAIWVLRNCESGK